MYPLSIFPRGLSSSSLSRGIWIVFRRVTLALCLSLTFQPDVASLHQFIKVWHLSDDRITESWKSIGVSAFIIPSISKNVALLAINNGQSYHRGRQAPSCADSSGCTGSGFYLDQWSRFHPCQVLCQTFQVPFYMACKMEPRWIGTQSVSYIQFRSK